MTEGWQSGDINFRHGVRTRESPEKKAATRRAISEALSQSAPNITALPEQPTPDIAPSAKRAERPKKNLHDA